MGGWERNPFDTTTITNCNTSSGAVVALVSVSSLSVCVCVDSNNQKGSFCVVGSIGCVVFGSCSLDVDHGFG